jgi:DNA repair photolyase
MKSYRYALAITSQFYFCGIPFRLDTSPKCSLNCLYCFAMSRGGRRTSRNLLADPRMIRNKFMRASQREVDELDIVGAFLKSNMPVHFGGMSDPFANLAVVSTSRELLKILAEFEYPTVISTKKSDELRQDETLSLLKRLRYLVVQVSISSSGELTDIIEPRAPTLADRLETLRLLHKEEIPTIVRLQPLFPTDVAQVTTELIPRLGETGVQHVIVEFLKLPVERAISRVADLFSKTGWDGLTFYKNVDALRTGREWVLPPEYKWELLQPLIEAIHSNGMTYGAGDYGLNHFSDTDCCCGIDAVEGFSEFFKPNIPYIIKKSKSDYLIFDEFQKIDIPEKSIRMYLNSQCRTDGATTLADYLRSKWNRPGTENAPDTFLGVSWHEEYDENGDCVYRKEIIQ